VHRFITVTGIQTLAISTCLSLWAPHVAAQRTVQRAAKNLDLPLHWVANRGQWPDHIACRTLGGSRTAELWRNRLRVRVGKSGSADDWLDVMFPSQFAALSGEGTGPMVSFFMGSDRKRWRSGVPTWSVARAADVLPGIDIVLRRGDGGIRYDVEFEPHADLEAMTFQVRAADSLTTDAEGQLVMSGVFGRVVQSKPVAWQLLPDGARESVACGFEIVGDQSYRFRVDGWCKNLPLVIDPTIAVGPDYATWFPSTRDLEVSSTGDMYLCGSVYEPPFPGGLAFKNLGNDLSDGALFVARISPSNSTPVGLALFGGNGGDNTFSIDLDQDEQELLVAISTNSTNFPVTNGATWLDGNQHAGLMAIDAASLTKLRFSTIFPDGRGVATVRTVSATAAVVMTDDDGVADYPGLSQWGQGGGSSDVVVWWVDLTPGVPTTGLPLRGWRIGGSDGDSASKVTVGADGSIYTLLMTGASSNTPAAGLLWTTTGAFRTAPTFASSGGRGKKKTQSTHDWDGFLMRFDKDMKTVEYATRIGGTGFDGGSGIDLEGCAVRGNRVALYGRTESSDFVPTLGGALSGARDGFVLQLDFTGFVPVTGWPTLHGGAYFGGSGEDDVNRAEFDADGRIHLAGRTRGNTGGSGKGRKKDPPNPFPVRDNGTGLFKDTPAAADGFYAVFNTSGALLYSSPIGTDGGNQSVRDFVIGPNGGLHFLVYTTDSSTALPTTSTAVFPTPPAYADWIAVFPPRM
jgi:hypothetical protein